MSDGTLQTLDVTMLEDVGTGANQLIQLDSNAKIPACSAAALTGVSTVTKSASDPVIATNPSGGVGTVWQNTTSGEMYVCTDATAGENVWTNVGAGSGNVAPIPDSTWQGTNYGYMIGGYAPTTDRIYRYSFTSDGNATDHANAVTTLMNPMACRSATYGYILGGRTAPPEVYVDHVTKFLFASSDNATDVSNLTQARGMGYASSNATHGYCAGGYVGAPAPNAWWNIIDKFAFANSNNATDIGDLTKVSAAGSSCISHSYGYVAGGDTASWADTNVIEKYSLITDGNATDVADLLGNHVYSAGVSSTTYGYVCAGKSGSTYTWSIDKFSFASDSNATAYSGIISGSPSNDHVGAISASSSSTHGYTTGGQKGVAPWTSCNNIDKFSYASEGNASDVGDIPDVPASVGSTYAVGIQY